MAMRRLAVILALSCTASAQNPWVNRRKNKDKDAPVAADPAAGDTDFSKLNDMVKNLQQAGAAEAAARPDAERPQRARFPRVPVDWAPLGRGV